MRWLYQTTKLLNFRTALQAHPDADTLQERFDSMVQVFTRYQIPVVTLRDLTIEEVCPIFERINSSGTRLSIFDLMVAATWSKQFDLNEKVIEIAEALQPKNFGDIRGTTVLKCLAAVESNSTNRERVLALRRLKKEPESMETLVANTRKAIVRAVGQLITDFKIYSLDFLPYERTWSSSPTSMPTTRHWTRLSSSVSVNGSGAPRSQSDTGGRRTLSSPATWRRSRTSCSRALRRMRTPMGAYQTSER